MKKFNRKFATYVREKGKNLNKIGRAMLTDRNGHTKIN